MFVYVVIILIVLAALYYILQLRPSNKKNIKELYAEGLDMLVSGKHQSAYKNFKYIVEKDSNNIKAYIRLGQVLREGGNILKAIKIHKNLLIRKNITSYELDILYPSSCL